MAEPNSPQPLTGQLVHLPGTARPYCRPLPDAVAIHPVDVPQADPPYDLADDTATLDRLDLARPARAQAPEPDHFTERYSAGPWPSQFAQALAETLAGTRPKSHIAPWTSKKARRRISQLSPGMATSSQPKLKRVIVSSPAGGVLEMTVVVDLGQVEIGQRVRALAVRLEFTDCPNPPSPNPPSPLAVSHRNRTEPFHRVTQPDPAGPGTLAEPRWHCTAIEAA